MTMTVGWINSLFQPPHCRWWLRENEDLKATFLVDQQPLAIATRIWPPLSWRLSAAKTIQNSTTTTEVHSTSLSATSNLYHFYFLPLFGSHLYNASLLFFFFSPITKLNSISFSPLSTSILFNSAVQPNKWVSWLLVFIISLYFLPFSTQHFQWKLHYCSVVLFLI